ncbi:GA20OX1 [Symbiodinium necroappetens]|uniref:GA20OX1 protein n=1 Tax=Symbiodinium necroappetens TaxID=1628268 RepID=A0A813C322_9DINO|nr:GA20OX1 [Symbiodinium necroappetens]
MRLWPGLRLVGAGGKVQKGVFFTVSEVGERVSQESAQSFEPWELLKHIRLCSAITYASVVSLQV